MIINSSPCGPRPSLYTTRHRPRGIEFPPLVLLEARHQSPAPSRTAHIRSVSSPQLGTVVGKKSLGWKTGPRHQAAELTHLGNNHSPPSHSLPRCGGFIWAPDRISPTVHGEEKRHPKGRRKQPPIFKTAERPTRCIYSEVTGKGVRPSSRIISYPDPAKGPRPIRQPYVALCFLFRGRGFAGWGIFPLCIHPFPFPIHPPLPAPMGCAPASSSCRMCPKRLGHQMHDTFDASAPRGVDI